MDHHDLFSGPEGFLTGVNYWASHAATRMWSEWDETVVENDLKALAGVGVRVLRVFPLWPDFQPITRHYKGDGTPVDYCFGEDPRPDTEAGRAGVSETMMLRFERFADLARQYGFRLIVALLTGQMTARLYLPPGLAGMNPVTDPEAQVWEVRLVKYFVGRMKHHPAVAAWDFGNECNLMGHAATAAEAGAWMTLIADAVRVCDREHPLISGMDGDSVNGGGWSVQQQAEHCDILTTHHYTMWRSSMSDPFDTIKATMFPVAQNRIYADLSGRPCFMEEIGSWRPLVGDFTVHRDYLRNLLWSLWANRGGGLLWWCGFDQDHLRTAPYDWDFAGLEHGLLGADYETRPTGRELRRFRELLDALPFRDLPAAAADAVCLLGDERQHHLNVGVGAWILAKQAGLELEFQHARRPLRDAACYLLPSACGKAGLGGANWEELRARVRAGATLFLSMDELYLDHFCEVFGAENHRRRTVSGGEFVFHDRDGEFRLRLPVKSAYEMAAAEAEVLARDGDGHPVFFSSNYGRGKVYLLAFPLERLMMEQPEAFLTAASSSAWRIYRLLAEALTPDRIISDKPPLLALTEHRRSETEAAAVAVNHADTPLEAELTLRDGWTLSGVVPTETAVTVRSGRVVLTLPPNAGALLLLAGTGDRP